MTPATLSVIVRRLWPRRIRARLAVMYTVLFLLAGTALLALTYTLAAHVLAPAPAGIVKPIPPRTGQLLGLCKRAQSPGKPPMSAALASLSHSKEPAQRGFVPPRRAVVQQTALHRPAGHQSSRNRVDLW